MNGIGQWLRNLGMKLRSGFQHFMMGRYGTDKLNTWILGAGVAACLISVLIPIPVVKLILTTVSYILLIWSIFRCFSRNTYKRYRENRRFLLLLDRFKVNVKLCKVREQLRDLDGEVAFYEAMAKELQNDETVKNAEKKVAAALKKAAKFAAQREKLQPELEKFQSLLKEEDRKVEALRQN